MTFHNYYSLHSSKVKQQFSQNGFLTIFLIQCPVVDWSVLCRYEVMTQDHSEPLITEYMVVSDGSIEF